jgi:hypothetical protein
LTWENFEEREKKGATRGNEGISTMVGWGRYENSAVVNDDLSSQGGEEVRSEARVVFIPSFYMFQHCCK